MNGLWLTRLSRAIGAVLCLWEAGAATAGVNQDNSLRPGGPVALKNNVYHIDANTRGTFSNGQRNVFFSFDQFKVESANTALFYCGAGCASTKNVISRVTDLNGATINGTLKSEIGGPNGHFYLLSPNGVVVGQGGVIDVPGTMHISTAQTLKFDNGKSFSATPVAGEEVSSLTADPTQFGFLKPGSKVSIPGRYEDENHQTRSGSLNVERGKLQISAHEVEVGGTLSAGPGAASLEIVGNRIRIAGTVDSAATVNDPDTGTAPRVAILGKNVEVGDGGLVSGGSTGNLTVGSGRASSRLNFDPQDFSDPSGQPTRTVAADEVQAVNGGIIEKTAGDNTVIKATKVLVDGGAQVSTTSSATGTLTVEATGTDADESDAALTVGDGGEIAGGHEGDVKVLASNATATVAVRSQGRIEGGNRGDLEVGHDGVSGSRRVRVQAGGSIEKTADGDLAVRGEQVLVEGDGSRLAMAPGAAGTFTVAATGADRALTVRNGGEIAGHQDGDMTVVASDSTATVDVDGGRITGGNRGDLRVGFDDGSQSRLVHVHRGGAIDKTGDGNLTTRAHAVLVEDAGSGIGAASRPAGTVAVEATAADDAVADPADATRTLKPLTVRNGGAIRGNQNGDMSVVVSNATPATVDVAGGSITGDNAGNLEVGFDDRGIARETHVHGGGKIEKTAGADLLVRSRSVRVEGRDGAGTSPSRIATGAGMSGDFTVEATEADPAGGSAVAVGGGAEIVGGNAGAMTVRAAHRDGRIVVENTARIQRSSNGALDVSGRRVIVAGTLKSDLGDINVQGDPSAGVATTGGRTEAGRDVNVAGSLSTGTLAAGRNVNVPGTAAATATSAGNDVELSRTGVLDSAATAAVRDIAVAGGTLNAGGTATAGRSVTVTDGGSIRKDSDGNLIVQGGGVAVTGANSKIEGPVSGGLKVEATANDLLVSDGGAILGRNQGGTVEIAAGAGTLRVGSGGTIRRRSGGALTVNAQRVVVDGLLKADAGDIEVTGNPAGGTVAAGGRTEASGDINVAGSLSTGTLAAGRDLNVYGTAAANATGAGNDVNVRGPGRLNAAATAAGRDVAVAGGTLNAGSTVTAGRNVVVTAGGAIGKDSDGDLAVRGAGVSVTGASSRIEGPGSGGLKIEATANDIGVGDGGAIRGHGPAGAMEISAGAGAVRADSGGTIERLGTGTLAVNAQRVVVDGLLRAGAGDIELIGNPAGGTVAAGGRTEAGGDIDVAGSLSTGTLATGRNVNVTGAASAGGSAEAGGDVNVAGSLRTGTLAAGRNVNVTGAASAGERTEAGGDINVAGSLRTGTLAAGRDVNVTGTAVAKGTGAGNDVNVRGPGALNSDITAAVRDVVVAGGTLDAGSSVTAGRNLAVTAGGAIVDNTGGNFGVKAQTVTVDGVNSRIEKTGGGTFAVEATGGGAADALAVSNGGRIAGNNRNGMNIAAKAGTVRVSGGGTITKANEGDLSVSGAAVAVSGKGSRIVRTPGRGSFSVEATGADGRSGGPALTVSDGGQIVGGDYRGAMRIEATKGSVVLSGTGAVQAGNTGDFSIRAGKGTLAVSGKNAIRAENSGTFFLKGKTLEVTGTGMDRAAKRPDSTVIAIANGGSAAIAANRIVGGNGALITASNSGDLEIRSLDPNNTRLFIDPIEIDKVNADGNLVFSGNAISLLDTTVKLDSGVIDGGNILFDIVGQNGNLSLIDSHISNLGSGENIRANNILFAAKSPFTFNVAGSVVETRTNPSGDGGTVTTTPASSQLNFGINNAGRFIPGGTGEYRVVEQSAPAIALDPLKSVFASTAEFKLGENIRQGATASLQAAMLSVVVRPVTKVDLDAMQASPCAKGGSSFSVSGLGGFGAEPSVILPFPVSADSGTSTEPVGGSVNVDQAPPAGPPGNPMASGQENDPGCRQTN